MSKPYTQAAGVVSQVPFQESLILYDDLEGLLKWTAEGTGADYAVELSETDCFYGNKSLHLKTRVTDPAANDYTRASRTIPVPSTNFIEASFLFKLSDNSDTSYFDFKIDFEYNLQRIQAGISYRGSSDIWAYINSAGSTVNLTGSDIPVTEDCWHRVKLRINVATGYYDKLTVDNDVFDMSALALNIEVATSKSKGLTYFQIKAAGATPPEAWIDDIILRADA